MISSIVLLVLIALAGEILIYLVIKKLDGPLILMLGYTIHAILVVCLYIAFLFLN